jgi:putative endonuclease
MYTLYILYSKSIDSYYVGYTNSIDRRLAEHNRKKGKFTDRGIPWEIVYSENFKSKEEAMDREMFIKSKKQDHLLLNLLTAGSAFRFAEGSWV